MTQPDLYQYLGVPRDATIEQINAAFREKAKHLHPDANKADPEAARHFKLLTQAYQLLTDPARRVKYDATLPPPVPEPVYLTDIADLWSAAGETFFREAARYTPAVDALRESVPLMMEGEHLLIVGIVPSKANLVGYLTTSETSNRINRILSDLAGKSMEFRLITGTDPAEWVQQRDAEARIRQKRLGATNGAVSAQQASSAMGNGESWEDLLDRLVPLWSALDNRSFPQVRARFVLEQLASLARAEEAARAAGGDDEMMQRQLARVLERLASLTSIDSGTIALEYVRYRARLLGGI